MSPGPTAITVWGAEEEAEAGAGAQVGEHTSDVFWELGQSWQGAAGETEEVVTNLQVT